MKALEEEIHLLKQELIMHDCLVRSSEFTVQWGCVPPSAPSTILWGLGKPLNIPHRGIVVEFQFPATGDLGFGFFFLPDS